MRVQQLCVIAVAFAVAAWSAVCVLCVRGWIARDLVLGLLENSLLHVALWCGWLGLASGTLGLAGGWSSSRGLLLASGVLSIVVAAGALGAGVALLVEANGRVASLRRECHGEGAKPSSPVGLQLQGAYDAMKQALRNCRRDGERPSSLGLEDCGQLGRDDRGLWFRRVPEMSLFAWLEELDGCGGFCVGDLPLFGFPATPGGAPVTQSSKLLARQPCVTRLSHELEVRGDWAAALLLLAVPLLAVSMLGVLWIVCHPPPSGRKDQEVHGRGRGQGVESHRLLGGGDDEGRSDDEEDVDRAYDDSDDEGGSCLGCFR